MSDDDEKLDRGLKRLMKPAAISPAFRQRLDQIPQQHAAQHATRWLWVRTPWFGGATAAAASLAVGVLVGALGLIPAAEDESNDVVTLLFDPTQELFGDDL